jgi:hypothetical protein
MTPIEIDSERKAPHPRATTQRVVAARSSELRYLVPKEPAWLIPVWNAPLADYVVKICLHARWRVALIISRVSGDARVIASS